MLPVGDIRELKSIAFDAIKDVSDKKNDATMTCLFDGQDCFYK